MRSDSALYVHSRNVDRVSHGCCFHYKWREIVVGRSGSIFCFLKINLYCAHSPRWRDSSECNAILFDRFSSFETQYKKDLQNYIEKGELGEDWCPQEVVSAIITWIRSNCKFLVGSLTFFLWIALILYLLLLVEADDPILSLGCGNGMLLNELVKINILTSLVCRF